MQELEGAQVVASGGERVVVGNVVLSNLRGFRLGPDSLSWEFAGELVWALQGWIYVTPRLLSFFWRGFLVILDLFQYFLYCYIRSQGSATIWRGDVCSGDIGAT